MSALDRVLGPALNSGSTFYWLCDLEQDISPPWVSASCSDGLWCEGF